MDTCTDCNNHISHPLFQELADLPLWQLALASVAAGAIAAGAWHAALWINTLI